ncbi:TadE/TadG family type IV pilus assembly protein [Acinetobacter venetianus]|uniref:TadE/TadG family type IV pilus assembly protein n=1 Tax=Acinetobacter venetianus TaxID=52133 RepID=UPI003A8D68BE
MKFFMRKQNGVTLVEFTIVASVFLVIIFSIFQIAIFAFTLQSLNDITRRSARIASVCVVDDVDIKSLVLTELKPVGFTAENIEIKYLNSSGGTPVNHGDIHYVQARVINYNYSFSGILRFLGDNGIVPVPDFKTIFPAESLGVLRVNDPTAKTDC